MSTIKIPLQKLVISAGKDGEISYSWYVAGTDIPVYEDKVWVGNGTLTFSRIPEYFELGDKVNINVLDAGLVAAISEGKK